MAGHHVFISYKVEEFDQALWVKNHLEENGVSCWMAPMSIRGGMSYAQEIPKAIADSSVFVLILSEKAQASKWVPRELDQAINCGKVIMPFVLEDCPLRNDFSFYLTNVQRYDAFRDMEGTMQRMTRDIQKMLGIAPPPPKAEKPPVVDDTPVEPPKVEPPEKQRADEKKEAKPVKQKQAPKKLPLPLLIVGAVLLVAIVVALLVPKGIRIGGEAFESDGYAVRLENATISRADLETLKKFVDLSVIRLENCTIQTQDLSALSLPGLMALELPGCNLTNRQLASIDFTQMTYLRELDVSENPELTDFSPLAPCAEKLNRLNISGTAPMDYDWLEQCVKLEVLKADRCSLQDLRVLERAIYLEELYLSENGVSVLDGLENTSKLMEVDLSHNFLTDVSVLSRSAQTLKYLNVSDNELTDLSCLSGAAQLRHVLADDNLLTSLAWLENANELVVLCAARNRLESISGLGFSSKLRCLNLAGNLLEKVEAGDIGFASGDYVVLDLSDNRLTELALPSGCTYRCLSLLGNPDLELSCVQDLQGWYLYFHFPADVKVETLKALSFTGLCMVDCPLNRQVEIEEGLNNEELTDIQVALEEIAAQIEGSIY